MRAPQRSWWGWGTEDAALDAAARTRLATLLATQLDIRSLVPRAVPAVSSLRMGASRFAVPSELEGAVTTARHDRAAHAYGKAFRDLVRALDGDLDAAPDAVAYPSDEDELVRLLAWCAARRIAAIPYGGGSSVVGGVEARIGDGYAGALSIDLGRMSGVREIDLASRAALIDAGTYGPALEAALAPHGLSLRHYPQSFEFSTLGGWIATRSAGHFATLYTHIDTLVESVRVATPGGLFETRRLPASGAGPAPERLWLGSEGALGVIVRAWMRLHARPRHRASATLGFTDFYRGAVAARALAQAGLHPANARLLDARETLVSGVGDGSASLLLIAFESADHPVGAWLERAVELARDAGGEPTENAPAPTFDTLDGSGAEDADAAARWRRSFLRAPYVRDALVLLGAIVETFETAVTWDRFESFHRGVLGRAREVLAAVCGDGMVTSRITHLYPDGAAPYFTLVAPARARSALGQWDDIKAAVSEAVLAGGGTITHHHAVGRDHRPWYDRERPEPFALALRAAKSALDPAWILNPGVLVDR
jgi:alkyldihydroxyacetonephosphate synthase